MKIECIYHYDVGREELVYSRKEEKPVRKSKSNIEENCSIDDFFGLPSSRIDGQNLKENFPNSLSFEKTNTPSFENKEE